VLLLPLFHEFSPMYITYKNIVPLKTL
jgi:hypothetical protein